MRFYFELRDSSCCLSLCLLAKLNLAVILRLLNRNCLARLIFRYWSSIFDRLITGL